MVIRLRGERDAKEKVMMQSSNHGSASDTGTENGGHNGVHADSGASSSGNVELGTMEETSDIEEGMSGLKQSQSGSGHGENGEYGRSHDEGRERLSIDFSGSFSEESEAQEVIEDTRMVKAKKTFIKWHLPIFLVLGVIIGAAAPSPGTTVSEETPMATICIIAIFFSNGLQLDTAQVKEALTNWKVYRGAAIMLGLTSILLVTPLLGFVFVELPFNPSEFGIGLAVFAAMPSTISSGVVLTQAAKGNVALALLFSVVSNMASVVSSSLWVSAFLSSGGTGSTLDPLDLLLRLTLTILVPIIAGKIIRSLSSRLRRLLKDCKNLLKVTTSFLLVLIPWMKVSEARDDFADTRVGDIFILIAAGAIMHSIYLLLNASLSFLFRIKPREMRAIVLAGSQKTLTVALALIAALPDEVGNQGLMIVACIVAHFSQILIDAFLSAWLAGRPSVSTKRDSVA